MSPPGNLNPPERHDDRGSIRVSVVAATYNRAALLRAHLDSVLAQDCDAPWEVVCVDDESTDDTPQVLEAYQRAHPERLKTLRVPNGGQGLARNAGARVARGALLLFTDDDCIAPPDWISGMLRTYDRQGCEVLSGGFAPYSLESGPERYLHYRGQILFGGAPKYVDVAPAMSLLVPAALFWEVGGFIAEPLEDWVLCHRLRARGARILYDPAVSVRHHYQTDWEGVRKRVETPAIRGIYTSAERGRTPGGLLCLTALKCLAAPFWIPRHFPPDLYGVALRMEWLFLRARARAWWHWRRGRNLPVRH